MAGSAGEANGSSLPSESFEIFLKARPEGMLEPERDFGTRRVQLPDTRSLRKEDVLVRVLFVSCDPAMRGWMSAESFYVPPVEIGAPMRAGGVGEVLFSGSKNFAVGDLVWGTLCWREYAVMRETDLLKVEIPHGVPISSFLGILGLTGLTGYFGLLDLGKPKKGDVVVVSAAAGATGSTVAQIAKTVIGCFTIGIAGGTEKCRYLSEELKLDAVVDYKAAKGVKEGLKNVLGDRTIDVYYDNVGGETLEAVLSSISVGARIVLCGAISQYNEGKDGGLGSELKDGPGARNYAQLISRRGSMHGFIVTDYASRFADARRDLASWLADGRIRTRETRVQGLEQAPSALLGLFHGKNIGKVVVEVAKPTHAQSDEKTS